VAWGGSLLETKEKIVKLRGDHLKRHQYSQNPTEPYNAEVSLHRRGNKTVKDSVHAAAAKVEIKTGGRSEEQYPAGEGPVADSPNSTKGLSILSSTGGDQSQNLPKFFEPLHAEPQKRPQESLRK